MNVESDRFATTVINKKEEIKGDRENIRRRRISWLLGLPEEEVLEGEVEEL
jgi:hypothetical protein